MVTSFTTFCLYESDSSGGVEWADVQSIWFSVMGSFTQHNVLEVHPRGSLCPNFLPCWGLNDIPLCINTFCASIHLLTDCFYLLATVNILPWTWVCKYLFMSLLSIFWVCTQKNCWILWLLKLLQLWALGAPVPPLARHSLTLQHVSLRHSSSPRSSCFSQELWFF